MSKNIYLIIQRTYNGLTTEYSTYPNTQLSKLNPILLDERVDSAQIAPNSTFYSVQNLGNIKVYSLINSTVKDVSKREGFFAIRLLLSSKNILVNAEAILNKVATRYVDNLQANNQVPQNYEDILQEAELQTTNLYKIGEIGSKDKYYYLYDSNDSLSSKLNSKTAEFVNLVYFFKDDNIVPEAINHFSFESAEILEDKLKIVEVDNSSRFLKSLDINGKPVKPMETQFKILVHQEDEIYSTNMEDKKTSHSPMHSQISIAGPQLRNKPKSNKPQTDNNKSFSLSSFLLGVAMMFLLFGIAFGAANLLDFNPFKGETPIIVNPENDPIDNSDGVTVDSELDDYKKLANLRSSGDSNGDKYLIIPRGNDQYIFVDNYIIKRDSKNSFEYVSLNNFKAVDNNMEDKLSKSKEKDVFNDFGMQLKETKPDDESVNQNVTTQQKIPEGQQGSQSKPSGNKTSKSNNEQSAVSTKDDVNPKNKKDKIDVKDAAKDKSKGFK